MIKMIKQLDDEIVYWEVWRDGKTLVIHYGTVGNTGETVKKKLALSQKAKKVMDELANEKANEGYDYLDEDELFELVVQYPCEENQMDAVLEKRHHVEELMNECLGWTGNGACDGGDIGSGTANIFNYVVDIEKATKTILNELKNNNLLEEVRMAYFHPEEENYIALYPEGTKFDLI